LKSGFKKDDVTILLKDLSGRISELDTDEREKRIQAGVHYSEMLPVEYKPSDRYVELYSLALQKFSQETALAVCSVAKQIFERKGEKVAIVSLARAGITTGILIKRFIEKMYGVSIAHYAISIIRGRGIDANAMGFILARHSAADIQFVDGWTGKGAIARELDAALSALFPDVDAALAVLADPPRLAALRGTCDDFLVPSSCLNAVVSGLLSRSILNDALIGKDDFHGAVFYDKLVQYDRTYEFVDSVEKYFDFDYVPAPSPCMGGESDVERIRRDFGIADINFVKPGIGEATRVLLRRVPWKLLVHCLDDKLYLGHLYRLAKEKNVEVVAYPMNAYRACGLIKKLDI